MAAIRVLRLGQECAMRYFLVTMEHPDDRKWSQLQPAHTAYLQELVAAEKVCTGGALVGGAPRASLLIFRVSDQAEVTELVMADPLFRENMILHLSIREWLPQCGMLPDAGVLRHVSDDLALPPGAPAR